MHHYHTWFLPVCWSLMYCKYSKILICLYQYQYIDEWCFKGSVSRDCWPLYFFHDSKPIGPQVFLNSFSISQRYFIIKCENSDSAVCMTIWRQLCDQISRRNRNRIRKFFSVFIRGPDGVESWKMKVENLVTHFL